MTTTAKLRLKKLKWQKGHVFAAHGRFTAKVFQWLMTGIYRDIQSLRYSSSIEGDLEMRDIWLPLGSHLCTAFRVSRNRMMSVGNATYTSLNQMGMLGEACGLAFLWKAVCFQLCLSLQELAARAIIPEPRETRWTLESEKVSWWKRPRGAGFLLLSAMRWSKIESRSFFALLSP